jgi:hypothetical protein
MNYEIKRIMNKKEASGDDKYDKESSIPIFQFFVASQKGI